MIERLAVASMGTRFELVLVGADRRLLRAAGEEALAEIELWDQRLSRFRSDSVVSHVNRSAAHAAVPIDAETFELFEACDQVWRASGGAFDPSLGAWMQRDDSGVKDVRERNLQDVGWGALELDRNRRRVAFRNAALQLDFGAIGKGFALDCAARALRAAGVTCGLLHGGTSSALALGAPPDQDAWTIALGPELDAPRAHIMDCALSLSAPKTDTSTCGHVLDPRTAHSVTQLARAAVVAPSAALADAWSTAMLVCADETQLPAHCHTTFATESAEQLAWTRPALSHSCFHFTELEASAS